MQQTREQNVISAAVDAETRAALQRRAAAADRTVSAEVRRAVRACLVPTWKCSTEKEETHMIGEGIFETDRPSGRAAGAVYPHSPAGHRQGA